MKTILLVEDDRRIAQNISRGLTDEGYTITTAYDGLEGRQLARAHAFDLLILDINLPGLNGYNLCREVRAENPYLPVLMLTALGEIEDKVTGLGVGADDYLVKPFDFRELLARVAACLRRADLRTEPADSEDIIAVANLTLNRTTREVFRDQTVIELTTKEFVLLEYLMQHTGRAISRLELTEHVWRIPFDTGTNVVEVYVNYLRKKIDRDFSPKLIHTRSGYGYVLKEEEA
ncbi:response regulator transcription factor [Spirosoma humi]